MTILQMKGRDWSGFWLAPAPRIFASRCWQPYSTPSITNRLVAIVHTKPVITILVPKLVAMATSLRPSIHVCLHWIAWPRKPTPRIIQPKLCRFKVYHHVWCGRAHIASHRLTPLF